MGSSRSIQPHYTMVTSAPLTMTDPDYTLIREWYIPRRASLGRGSAPLLGVEIVNAESHGRSQWRRSSSCYDGTCVEARVSGGKVLLRDSKCPDHLAIPLAFREWAVFMTLVRNARWGESFDLMSVPQPRREHEMIKPA